MYYRNYRQSKTWLEHSQKTRFSVIFLRVNVLKGPKHFWCLHERTFIIFFPHSENKWFAKYLPNWNLKSEGCLLTHWLPMTSILFGVLRTCCSLFKWNYIKNENIFLNFLFLFRNLHQILKDFLKKDHRPSKF